MVNIGQKNTVFFILIIIIVRLVHINIEATVMQQFTFSPVMLVYRLQSRIVTIRVHY